MRALLGVSLAAVLLMAGCSGSSSDSTSSSPSSGASSSGPSSSASKTTSSGSGPSTTTGTGTTSTGGSGQAPVIRSFAPSATSGSLPFTVNFTLDATDADSASLTWTLALGDGSAGLSGSTLPATPGHTYTAAGNFSATFTVTDGQHPVNKTIVVVVTAAASAGFTPIDEEMDVAGWCLQCFFASDTTTCAGFRAGQNGRDCAWFTLPANAEGHTFVASSVGTTGDNDVGIEFFGTCSVTSNSLGFMDDVGGDETGTVPTGAGCIVLYENLDVANTLRIVVT